MPSKGLKGALLVLSAVAGGCIVSPDPGLYIDAPRPDGAGTDAHTADTPRGDSNGPALDLAVPDTLAPDAALATYYRTWVSGPATTNPGKLWGPKLAHDPTTGDVMLYGGKDSASAPVALSWVYDGTSWNKLCDPCLPGPRVGHGLVTDEKRGVVVLFGGKNATTVLNDIWELAAGVWKQVSPAGTPPSARQGAFVVFDPLRGRTVVFGGLDANGVRLDDAYEYDGTAWHGPFVPAVRPSARSNMGSAATFADSRTLAVSTRNRVVIFGGEVAAKTTVDDCWAWDGASWSPVCTTCTKTGRTGAALGYDPATGRLVLVNGWTGTAEISGTVELPGQSWSQTTILPGSRDHSSMVFDTKRNRFVLFGGNGDACSGNCDETLEYVAP